MRACPLEEAALFDTGAPGSTLTMSEGSPRKGAESPLPTTRPGGDPSNLIRVMPAKGRDLPHLRFSGISLA